MNLFQRGNGRLFRVTGLRISRIQVSPIDEPISEFRCTARPTQFVGDVRRVTPNPGLKLWINDNGCGPVFPPYCLYAGFNFMLHDFPNLANRRAATIQIEYDQRIAKILCPTFQKRVCLLVAAWIMFGMTIEFVGEWRNIQRLVPSKQSHECLFHIQISDQNDEIVARHGASR